MGVHAEPVVVSRGPFAFVIHVVSDDVHGDASRDGQRGERAAERVRGDVLVDPDVLAEPLFR